MLTQLRAKHNDKEQPGLMWGIDGNTATIEDMEAKDIWDPCAVKL